MINDHFIQEYYKNLNKYNLFLSTTFIYSALISSFAVGLSFRLMRTLKQAFDKAENSLSIEPQSFEATSDGYDDQAPVSLNINDKYQQKPNQNYNQLRGKDPEEIKIEMFLQKHKNKGKISSQMSNNFWNGGQQRYIEKVLKNIHCCSPKNQKNRFNHSKRKLYPQITRLFSRETGCKTYPVNEAEKTKYLQKQAIAISFCKHGYGVNFVRAQIAENQIPIEIDKPRYIILIASVITESYRRMQYFLREDCKKQIQFTSALELRPLFTFLYNCKTTLQPQQCTTFLNFIKITYGIESLTMKQSAATALYHAIQVFLHSRLLKRPIAPKEQLNRTHRKYTFKNGFRAQRSQKPNNVWTPSLQHEFLRLYKDSTKFQPIRAHFQKVYPQYAEEFSKSGIRCRLFKILRLAIRNIKKSINLVGETNFQSIPDFSDRMLKMIFNKPGYMPCRKILAELYMKDDYSVPHLQGVLPEIQKVIRTNETYQMYKKEKEKRQKMELVDPMELASQYQIQYKKRSKRANRYAIDQ